MTVAYPHARRTPSSTPITRRRGSLTKRIAGSKTTCLRNPRSGVEAQNVVTFAHLDTIPFRRALATRLEQLFDTEYATNRSAAAASLFTRNAGLQNQAVVYDAARLRADGLQFHRRSMRGKCCSIPMPLAGRHDQLRRSRYQAMAPTPVYGLSKGETDWIMRVSNVITGVPTDDVVRWVKVSGAAWGDGFFYSRYPEPEPGRELSTRNADHPVFFHRLGTAQSRR